MTNQEAINGLKNIIEYWTYRPTEVETANLAIQALEKQLNGGWIPVSERLPEEKGWYLVYVKEQRPYVAYFKGKTFPLNNHYHEIIAWQPLPSAWEGETKVKNNRG